MVETVDDPLYTTLLPVAIEGDDGSHDLDHIHRVLRNAFTIQAEEGGDREILTAAVMLHDCVSFPKNSPERIQASRLAAEKAANILQRMAWTRDRIDSVAHAIEAHSFSAGIPPQSIEARILQDADRLDAIGMVGIARCFYTAGRIGSKLYHPHDPSGTHRARDDGRYALDHFYTKLLTLATDFQTVTGKRMAQQRHAGVARFVNEFLAEL